MQVGVRLRSGRARERDRQATARGRSRPRGSTRSPAAPSSPGKNACSTARGACLAVQRPVDRVRPTGQQDHHDRGSRRDDRLDQLALHAGQLEALDVVALADRAAAEQSRAVADDDDRDVGLARPPPPPRRCRSGRGPRRRSPARTVSCGVGELRAETHRSTVGISKPSSTSGWCARTWFANE